MSDREKGQEEGNGDVVVGTVGGHSQSACVSAGERERERIRASDMLEDL